MASAELSSVESLRIKAKILQFRPAARVLNVFFHIMASLLSPGQRGPVNQGDFAKLLQ